jgi:hypothetical protein
LAEGTFDACDDLRAKSPLAKRGALLKGRTIAAGLEAA